MSKTTSPRPAPAYGARWSARTAEQVLKEWRASGVSLAEFAESRGLKKERLQRWQERLPNIEKPSPSSMEFAPVASSEGTWSVSAAVSVRWTRDGEVRLEVHDPSAVEPVWLGEVARVLRGKEGA